MRIETRDSATSLAELAEARTVVRRIVRLVVVGAVSWIVYSAATTESWGGCDGGFDADGGFIDASGTPTSVAPICTDATLVPSGLIQVALIAIVISGVVLGFRIPSAEKANRLLVRLTVSAIVIAVVCATASVIWFRAIPLESKPHAPHVIGVGTELVQSYPMER